MGDEMLRGSGARWLQAAEVGGRGVRFGLVLRQHHTGWRFWVVNVGCGGTSGGVSLQVVVFLG